MPPSRTAAGNSCSSPAVVPLRCERGGSAEGTRPAGSGAEVGTAGAAITREGSRRAARSGRLPDSADVEWWVAAGTALAVIAPVELPDKTFVATLVLATRYRPWPVWLGVAGAFAVQVIVAVVAGGL